MTIRFSETRVVHRHRVEEDCSICDSRLRSQAVRNALEAEWYNGNLDEKAYDRILKVLAELSA